MALCRRILIVKEADALLAQSNGNLLDVSTIFTGVRQCYVIVKDLAMCMAHPCTITLERELAQLAV